METRKIERVFHVLKALKQFGINRFKFQRQLSI